MKCKKCQNTVIQKSEKGVRIRLDGPMEVSGEGLVKAKCFWCKAAVELPLELKKSFVQERYVIKTQGGA